MGRLLRALTAILVIGLLGAAYIQYRVSTLNEPISDASADFRLVVTPGMTFKQVTIRLKRDGIVNDALAFEWYGRWIGADRKVRAGVYTIAADWTPRRLLKELEKGTLPKAVRVTLPEGFNRWQMADRLAKAGLIDRTSFLKRVEMERLEGRLFPDTYHFNPGVQTDAVIERLNRKFKTVFRQVIEATNPAKEIPNTERLISLASLVQKEAGVYDDQRKVARVFLNRLKKGMKLQTDPTCVYGPKRYTRVPRPADCKDPNNLYSTYIIDGLPPGPIGNPGRDAIRAVLHPYTGPRATKLLYFVARRDGSKKHHFSESYKAHRQAIRTYLKRDSRAGD